MSVAIVIEKIVRSKIVFIITILVIILEFIVLYNVDDKFKLTFLDVGQGDSILIKTSLNRYILVDSGEDDAVLSELDDVMPFWNKKIDVLIGTHSDTDHIGGMRYLLDSYEIGTIIVNSNGVIDSELERIKEIAGKKEIRIISLHAGDRIRSKKLNLKCLWPENDYTSDDDNSKSIVLLGELEKLDFLLTGDIEKDQEERLVSDHKLSDIDLLKVAHHGSKSSTTIDFLNRVKPEFAVISCGEGNKFNHPSEEVVKRLLGTGAKLFRTDMNGKVEFESDGYVIYIKVEK